MHHVRIKSLRKRVKLLTHVTYKSMVFVLHPECNTHHNHTNNHIMTKLSNYVICITELFIKTDNEIINIDFEMKTPSLI